MVGGDEGAWRTVVAVDGIELRFHSLGDFWRGCFGANASAADTRELSFDLFSLTERRNDSSTCCYHCCLGSPGLR